jgi:hypothetical protein
LPTGLLALIGVIYYILRARRPTDLVRISTEV